MDDRVLISALGHYDTATLQNVAQSILERSPTNPKSGLAVPGRPPPPVADASAADALLPFKVVLPSNATPASLGVYGHQGLTAHFGTPDGGYDRVEQSTDETVASLRELAKHWKVGRAELLVIQGVHVLVQSEHVRSAGRDLTVSWIRGDGTIPVLTWLTGVRTLTQHNALAVAANLIAQGG